MSVRITLSERRITNDFAGDDKATFARILTVTYHAIERTNECPSPEPNRLNERPRLAPAEVGLAIRERHG